MFNKGLILVALIIIGSTLPAHADPIRAKTACQTIDNVLGTFSLVRDIQIDKKNRNYAQNISGLEELVGQISLPAIVPPQSRNGLATENQTLFQYMASLREAIAGAKAGYDDYARQILNSAVTDEFPRSIQSLEYYWNCRPEEPSTRTEAESPNEKPSYLGASGAGVKSAPVALSRPFAETSPARDRPANNRLSQQLKFALPTPLANASLLFPLTVLLILIGIFTYAQKRSKTFKAREARRFIHKPVRIRIGKTVYDSMIMDISMNGAKIQHQGLIQNQKKLSIELDGNWHTGQIKWSNKMFAGIRFDRPVSSQSLNALLQTV